MNSSFSFDSINLGWSIVYIEGSQIKILIKSVLISLNIVFVFTSSAGPKEMQHDAAFHLDIYCLPKYAYTGALSYDFE